MTEKNPNQIKQNHFSLCPSVGGAIQLQVHNILYGYTYHIILSPTPQKQYTKRLKQWLHCIHINSKIVQIFFVVHYVQYICTHCFIWCIMYNIYIFFQRNHIIMAICVRQWRFENMDDEKKTAILSIWQQIIVIKEYFKWYIRSKEKGYR